MIFTSFIPNTNLKIHILLAKIKKNLINLTVSLNLISVTVRNIQDLIQLVPSHIPRFLLIDYDLALFTLNNKLESQKLTSNDLQSKIDDSDILKLLITDIMILLTLKSLNLLLNQKINY